MTLDFVLINTPTMLMLTLVGASILSLIINKLNNQ